MNRYTTKLTTQESIGAAFMVIALITGIGTLILVTAVIYKVTR